MSYPGWIDSQGGIRKQSWQRMWDKPWKVPASSHRKKAFKEELWDHGYLSPNFTRSEAKSKDGTSIPRSLRAKAQYHAFRLERVRHKIGDKPLRPLSWYRSPEHNAAVGGVPNSQHVQAWATDWATPNPQSWAFEKVFRNGGIGTRYGQVAHVDNGTARRWVY